ncbi:MAG TPA: glycerate kinase, partial [Candidatus Dormibacteraeota bacterium]|nr:glycerate kinase [Candidatus Dormibacteraeota bacterium]
MWPKTGAAPVVIAPNAFKGTCSAEDAARAIARGVADVWPAAPLRLVPMADGGDGFSEVLRRATGGRCRRHRVQGPLGRPATGTITWLGGEQRGTVAIELAAVAGLRLVGRPTPATALRASTAGLGELIARALDRGARRVLVGVGGSASTDGGAGLAAALGYRLLDARGRALPPGGGALRRLARIDADGRHPGLAGVELVVACDVDTPLRGRRGAAAVFAPQKGADPPAVRALAAGLARLAQVVARDLGVGGDDAPGMGAAGGSAFGLHAFCGGRLVGGAALVADLTEIDQALRGARAALTGEGRFDAQSLRGKAPMEVMRRAAAAGVPRVLLAGAVEPAAERALADLGGACLVLGDGPQTLTAAHRETRAALRRAAARACRLWDQADQLS